MESLEKIDDDCDLRGIHFVKIGETGAEEAYGIEKTPKLVYFKNDLPNMFEGKRHRGAAVKEDDDLVHAQLCFPHFL